MGWKKRIRRGIFSPVPAAVPPAAIKLTQPPAFSAYPEADKTDIIISRRVSLCCAETSGFENRHSNGYTGGFNSDDSLKISSAFKHDYIELKNLVLPVSSTEIRARIANNFGWRYLVPDGVFEYILKYKLYGCKN